MGYVTGTKWGSGVGTTTISWSFATLPGDLVTFTAALADSAYRSAVAAAFDAWEAVADIDFVYLSDSRSNDIRLGWSDIDGAGGTLGSAHWRYRGTSTIEAEIRFDSAEPWAPQTGGNGTFNFYAVALHEIGHAIGLSHAEGVRSSIMYPYLTSVATLSADDVAEIQGLYGVKPVPVAVAAPAPAPVAAPAPPPANEIAGVNPPVAPAATQDVFRFFNAETGVHFYTASAGERDAILDRHPQFAFEGRAFDVPAGSGDLAVYRFHNTQTGAHFYTASEAERDAVLARHPHFTPEGSAFNAYSDAGANAEHQALHRFLKTDTGTHFYTASEAERAHVETTMAHYRYEGVAYYVDFA
ncbi:matrixin family metalloprotease [Fulvimarina sp. 2208YS6-2-32]|uniref:Matrixin family metalloprotease n=1 Tax=Fulvimarina uroteuthidis TaxID=3098149 RepID=A0ABU5I0F8_9HYPH|nr:matrixin family metalloprotease [Fulvimarina sp. 2208YS6-2-32]MDY8108869.1 matrixin family metalloprotease [Fulvimarina sp. 2208YS6-2-32]